MSNPTSKTRNPHIPEALIYLLEGDALGHLATVRADLHAWMHVHEYESITQMRGSMSQRAVADPSTFERRRREGHSRRTRSMPAARISDASTA